MKPFSYARADNRADAIAQAADKALFIAGGTNLLDLMKLEVMAPDRLVDISRLDLAKIDETEAGGLRIGALVTNSDCAAHVRVRQLYPVLSRAILAGASGQLRNKATTGGNLCQRMLTVPSGWCRFAIFICCRRIIRKRTISWSRAI